MSNKTISILFIIFLIVTGIAFFPFIQKRMGRNENLEFSKELPFHIFTKDTVQKIMIKKQQEFSLVKEENNWNVASYSAYQPIVDAFLQAIQESKPVSIVSRNETNSEEYGISSSSGIFLNLRSANGEEQTFIIGNDGPEIGSFYAKVPDSKNVFLVKGSLRDTIKTTVNDWRNKRLATFSSGDIHSIEVQGASQFVLQRKETQWELTYKGRTKSIEQEKMSSILSQLSFLEGKDFLTDQEHKEFMSATKNTMIIKNKDGNVLVELLYIQKNPDYWIKKSDSSDSMKISSYILRDLFNLLSQ